MPSRSHLSLSHYQHPQSSFLHGKMNPTSHPPASQAPQTPNPHKLYSLRPSRPPFDVTAFDPLEAPFTPLAAFTSLVQERASAFEILSQQQMQPDQTAHDGQMARLFWRERSQEMESLNELIEWWKDETRNFAVRRFHEAMGP